MALQIKRLSNVLGAEVRGVNLAEQLTDKVFDEIIGVWLENLVLVFPDQTLTNEEHIVFSQKFGKLEVHPSRKHILKDYPEILLLTNRRDSVGNYVSLRDGGSIWHSDLSYMQEPSRCSLLYALDVPESGGDTEWANMYRAYDALPEKLKEKITGLKAVHQFDLAENPRFGMPKEMIEKKTKGSIWEKTSDAIKARTPDATHPIIRTHRNTGRRALFVTRRFTTRIVNMDANEGEALLLELFEYTEKPEHIYHHKWSNNQLVLWDNRCTSHLACGGVPDSQLRTMQRTTVRGEIPV